jgi:small subunit ribosomal protein S17
MAEVAENKRSPRKERRGVVVSRSGDKSIVVLIKTRKRHPLYGKTITRNKRFHAHDERNEAAVGDKVSIAECRPLSRLKRWRLVKVWAPAGRKD